MGTDPDIISRDELHDLIESDSVFYLVEALPEESFEEGHLPGAIDLPGDRIRDFAPERIPDRETKVVVYCANPACTASDRAARLLLEMGYEDVSDYRGGKEHWREGGLPMEEPAAATA